MSLEFCEYSRYFVAVSFIFNIYTRKQLLTNINVSKTIDMVGTIQNRQKQLAGFGREYVEPSIIPVFILCFDT